MNIPIKHIKRPKDLLTGLDCQDTKREPFLALVESQPVRQTNSNALVVLEPLVVSPNGAVHESKQQALKRHHGIIHENRLEGPLPLLLTRRDLLEIWLFTRQRGDRKDQVQLRKLVVVLDLIRVRHKLLVDAKKSRLVEDREKGRPLLEVNIDAAVGEQPWRNPHLRRWLFLCERIAPLDVQKRFWIEIGTRLAILLHLPLA